MNGLNNVLKKGINKKMVIPGMKNIPKITNIFTEF